MKTQRHGELDGGGSVTPGRRQSRQVPGTAGDRQGRSAMIGRSPHHDNAEWLSVWTPNSVRVGTAKTKHGHVHRGKLQHRLGGRPPRSLKSEAGRGPPCQPAAQRRVSPEHLGTATVIDRILAYKITLHMISGTEVPRRMFSDPNRVKRPVTGKPLTAQRVNSPLLNTSRAKSQSQGEREDILNEDGKQS